MKTSELVSYIKNKDVSTKRPKHIFIVEDNEIYYRMQDYILSKENIYQFLSFNSVEQCIQNLHLNPDVIILDSDLSGMNGSETLLEIKKHTPHTHVVILSGNNEIGYTNELIKGADDQNALERSILLE